jgi:hypothetical protein
MAIIFIDYIAWAKSPFFSSKKYGLSTKKKSEYSIIPMLGISKIITT